MNTKHLLALIVAVVGVAPVVDAQVLGGSVGGNLGGAVNGALGGPAGLGARGDIAASGGAMIDTGDTVTRTTGRATERAAQARQAAQGRATAAASRVPATAAGASAASNAAASAALDQTGHVATSGEATGSALAQVKREATAQDPAQPATPAPMLDVASDATASQDAAIGLTGADDGSAPSGATQSPSREPKRSKETKRGGGVQP
jgi:hypothetical protein